MTQRGYGQFCPVAKAAEIITERWTPLVIRELLMGSRRFNELRRGVPLMSPSLLSDRLKALERAGIVRQERANGHPEYYLTSAGQELRPVVEMLGVWGQPWVRSRVDEAELDVSLLMWDIRRGVRRRQGKRDGRIVVRFEYADAPRGKKHWWLVLDGGQTDLCLTDPGYSVDLRVVTDVSTMTKVWMGDIAFGEALRARKLQFEGPAKLKRSFPTWLSLSPFAGVERPER